MKYAVSNGQRIEATPSAVGTCPCCGADMITKCGDLKVWHWAHKSKRVCDHWWEIILSNMDNQTEATIRDAFIQCFSDDSDTTRSVMENRRMAKALILAGWERAGKFNTVERRNQTRFVNSLGSQ